MASLDDTGNPSGHLIAARRVQGAAVFNTALERLGSIEDVIIDKASGRIAYAVLHFGGFLGFGDHKYPLPWEKLTDNPEIDGYVVDLDRDRLEGAPAYDSNASWEDRKWGEEVYAYYGAKPFWDLIP